jgi:hypothetical protein
MKCSNLLSENEMMNRVVSQVLVAIRCFTLSQFEDEMLRSESDMQIVVLV